MDQDGEYDSNKKFKFDKGVLSEGVKANDVIKIRFFDYKDSLIGNDCHPSFTHQLFENELIDFVGENDESIEVCICIRCTDLATYVLYPDKWSEVEILSVKSKIINALPEPDKLFHYNVSQSSSFCTVCNDFTENVNKWPVIDEFNVKEDKYEIKLVKYSDCGSSLLLRDCEKLAIWFIETADSIDFKDDRWEALFLFRKHGDKREIVGYFTLFSFLNPFAGSKLRICQALIFPPFQNIGLGHRLMQTTYKLAYERNEVVEITVEDPAPSFIILRDKTDVKWLFDRFIHLNGGLKEGKMKYSEFPNLLASLKDSTSKLVNCLKITKSQLIFVINSIDYFMLIHNENSISIQGDTENNADSKELKTFRLSIKRQLLKSNIDLKSLPKQEMQTALEELYADEQQRFASVEKIIMSYLVILS